MVKRKQMTRGTRSNLVVLLAGLAGFLYQMQDLLRHHVGSSMDYYASPVGLGEILFALFSGVAAMLAALGLNVHALVRPFLSSEGEDQ